MNLEFKKTDVEYTILTSWRGGKEEWQDLKEHIKKIPGSKFIPEDKCWQIPVEVINDVASTAMELGYKVDFGDTLPEKTKVIGKDSEFTKCPNGDDIVGMGDSFRDLYQYQKITARDGAARMAWLWNFEMGLGKTASVLLALELRQAKQILIVCPAMARRTWEDEIEKWWDKHPPIQAVKNGNDAEAIFEPIVIVSYGLLQRLGKRSGYDAIIFDEIHYLQNPDARRSIEARKILAENPEAWKAGLTGTLITNEPTSAYNVFDLLYPGRVGSYYDWAFRYSIAEHNGYGYTFKGVNARYEEELRQRLREMSTRVSKRDVSHLLPAFTTRIYQSQNKLRDAKELAQDALKGGARNVCLLTYRRQSCKDLLQMLGPGNWGVTGHLLPEQRHDIIAKVKETPGACLVATIDSTKVSIDLSFFSHVIYVDLVYDLSSVIQSLGRFHRLSGSGNVDITLLAGERDNKARTIKRKIEALNKIIKAGSAEGQLESVLGEFKELELSNEEMNELIVIAAEAFTGLDVSVDF